jgi:tight adherence protein B
VDVVVALACAVTSAIVALLVLDAARRSARRYGASIDAVAEHGLADLFVFVDPRRLRFASAAFVIAVLVVVVAAGAPPAVAAMACVVAFAGPALVHRWLRRRRERQLVAQLPDSLDALAGGLRAGLGLAQALAALAEQQPAPTRHEYALLLRKQRLGMSMDQALEELAARAPRQEFVLFVTAVRIAREVGGNLAETLDRLSDTLRRKLAMEERIDALTSQGRLQGWVVGTLPLLLLWVLHLLEPETMRTLYTTPHGWGVLAVLAVLLGIGALLIRRIVRIDV